MGDKLVRWWPRAAESDPRPGGKLLLWWSADTSDRSISNHCETVFRTFDPPNKVSFLMWESPTSFRIDSVEGKTRLRLTDEGAYGDSAADVARTWGFLMANLKAYLQFGVDLRSPNGWF